MPLTRLRGRMVACLLLIASAAQAAPPVQIADLRPGIVASVQGQVDRILDEDTFTLRDRSGVIEVYVGPNPLPVRPGDSVTVQGILDDDGLRPELYARALTLTTGRTVLLSQSYD